MTVLLGTFRVLFSINLLDNRHIIVISDLSSRLARSVALPDTAVQTIALAFVRSWYGHYGAHTSILSDSGANFKSEVNADKKFILSFGQVHTALYHPEANRVVERLNRTFTFKM